MNEFQLLVAILLLIFVPLIPFLFFFYYALKQGRLTIRLLSVILALYLLTVSVILWIWVRESWLLYLAVGVSLFNMLAVLSWPVTAPNVVKRLGLKW